MKSKLKPRNFTNDVREKLEQLRNRHPEPIHSAHEGYGLLLEEVDEVWEEVKRKNSLRDYTAVYLELVQIAARAQRFAEDVVLPRTSK